MKSVPILSKSRKPSKARSKGQKLKLHTVLQQLSDQDESSDNTGLPSSSRASEAEVAAIAAAIYSITGKVRSQKL